MVFTWEHHQQHAIRPAEKEDTTREKLLGSPGEDLALLEPHVRCVRHAPPGLPKPGTGKALDVGAAASAHLVLEALSGMPHVRREHQAHLLGEPQFQVRRCSARHELAAFGLAVVNDKLLIACKSRFVSTLCVPFNKQVQVVFVAFHALFVTRLP